MNCKQVKISENILQEVEKVTPKLGHSAARFRNHERIPPRFEV